MTLCGLLIGTEPHELLRKMKVRSVTNVDLVIDQSFYDFDTPRYSVRVNEICRAKGKPAFFSDRIVYRDSIYKGQRFVSAYRKSFHYPVAGDIAFETALLLQRNEIIVTVNSKSIDAAIMEYRENIKRAIAANLSGL